MSPVLVDLQICLLLSGLLLLPEALWGDQEAFAALQNINPPQKLDWRWRGVMHVTENCAVGSIFSSATNFPFNFWTKLLKLLLPCPVQNEAECTFCMGIIFK